MRRIGRLGHVQNVEDPLAVSARTVRKLDRRRYLVTYGQPESTAVRTTRRARDSRFLPRHSKLLAILSAEPRSVSSLSTEQSRLSAGRLAPRINPRCRSAESLDTTRWRFREGHRAKSVCFPRRSGSHEMWFLRPFAGLAQRDCRSLRSPADSGLATLKVWS